MKKICFICYGNLYLTPYLKNYLDIIPGESDVDILVWNRHNIEEKNKYYKIYSYNYFVDDNCSTKVRKLKGYIGFSVFTAKKLMNKDYDIVICLQSVGSICEFPILLTKYRKKYIVDIRDYSVEGSFFLKQMEGVLMNTSKLNVISSEGYKAFLPQGRRYILVHNYSDVSVEIIKEFGKKTQNTPLRLSYIGLIRFQEQNKKIIDLFANDKRFLLQFIGKNAMELEEYVTTHHIENVRLIDQFPSDKTMDFYRNTDVILNAYGNHTPLLDYALSNKLYYAAALRLPILVSKDTYMEKIAVEGGFGFTLDIDDISIKEKFISWINGLDRIEFEKKCDKFMRRVKKDNNEFNTTIRKIFEE